MNDIVLIDTPGQIEVFTWSASGNIITEALAAQFPTCVTYVLDTVRSTNPVTFMSNMLYACSILYKTRLPFIIAMNKADVVSHQEKRGLRTPKIIFDFCNGGSNYFNSFFSQTFWH